MNEIQNKKENLEDIYLDLKQIKRDYKELLFLLSKLGIENKDISKIIDKFLNYIDVFFVYYKKVYLGYEFKHKDQLENYWQDLFEINQELDPIIKEYVIDCLFKIYNNWDDYSHLSKYILKLKNRIKNLK